MAGQQRGPKPQSTRGDFTGNQKEVLQRQHEDAVNARRDELGIITAGNQAIRDEGVIDLTSGTPVLEHPDLAPEDAEQLDVVSRPEGVTVQERAAAPLPEGTPIGGGTMNIDVRELPEERPQAAVSKGEVLTKEKLNEPTLVRAEYDLDDITIGYGNTFTLKQGYRYRVPRWVAAHLEEKGLATVLSLNVA